MSTDIVGIYYRYGSYYLVQTKPDVWSPYTQATWPIDAAPEQVLEALAVFELAGPGANIPGFGKDHRVWNGGIWIAGPFYEIDKALALRLLGGPLTTTKT